MKVIQSILPLFFRHLYTTYAGLYDAVANLTSMGQWNTWQKAVVEHLPSDGIVLEIGHGTGHLLLNLTGSGMQVIAIDPSVQMNRIAAARLKKAGYQPRIARARAQELPFASEAFAAAVCTFPGAYIFEPETISELRRVLQAHGTFVTALVAFITGKSLPDRMAAWLYRVTGESGPIPSSWSDRWCQAGFRVNMDQVRQSRAEVVCMVGEKKH